MQVAIAPGAADFIAGKGGRITLVMQAKMC